MMAAGQEYLMNLNFCIFQLLIWKNRVYKFIKSKLSAEDPKCEISDLSEKVFKLFRKRKGGV